MYYPELESLLHDDNLTFATESDVYCIDKYLATLNHCQAIKFSPWRIAKKTNISLDAVIEILLHAAKLNLVSIRYEVWHPISRISIFDTFDQSKIYHPIECNEEQSGQYTPTDYDIHISFRLNQIQNIHDPANIKKKEKLKAITQRKENHQEDAHNDVTLEQIKTNPPLSQIFRDCTFHITDVSQSGTNNNAALSGGTIKQSVNNAVKEKPSMLALILQHPIISAVIAGLLIIMISATPLWESTMKHIPSDNTNESIHTAPAKPDPKINKRQIQHSINQSQH